MSCVVDLQTLQNHGEKGAITVAAATGFEPTQGLDASRSTPVLPMEKPKPPDVRMSAERFDDPLGRSPNVRLTLRALLAQARRVNRNDCARQTSVLRHAPSNRSSRPSMPIKFGWAATIRIRTCVHPLRSQPRNFVCLNRLLQHSFLRDLREYGAHAICVVVPDSMEIIRLP
jgi:hypothetical protein